jgi:hypothetical protein
VPEQPHRVFFAQKIARRSKFGKSKRPVAPVPVDDVQTGANEMSRGGYRPGAGRPKGCGKQVREPANPSFPADVKRAANKAGLTPLEYALWIMNDPEADPARRDRMCFLAMPFLHARRT